MAGEIAEPRDLAGGGGGEEPLGSGGAGEDEATGGDGESADGRGAAEGAGLLFVGGDGAAGGLVEVLDDMARHETINLHKLSRPCGSLRCRGSGRGDERRRKPQPPRRRGSAPPPAPGHARRRAAAAGSGPARPIRSFHPPGGAISRGAKNSRGRGGSPFPLLCLLPCSLLCSVAFCCSWRAGGWCLPHLRVVSCEAAGGGCMAAAGGRPASLESQRAT